MVAVSLSCAACDSSMWQLFSNLDTHSMRRHTGPGTPRHLGKDNGPSCLKRKSSEKEKKSCIAEKYYEKAQRETQS